MLTAFQVQEEKVQEFVLYLQGSCHTGIGSDGENALQVGEYLPCDAVVEACLWEKH